MGAILKYIMMYAIIRAVVALGFGIVTYGAILNSLHNPINEIRTVYNTPPAEVLQFLAIAEVPKAVGIFLGATVAAASIRFAKRIAFIGG